MTKRIGSFAGEVLFTGRWILPYFYLGLQFAILLYVYKYTLMIWDIVKDVKDSPEDTFMLGILGLVDVTMIVNLVDMIKGGSYTIFVRRFNIHKDDERPQWLDHMSTGLQKVKMSASILGISTVHLLKSFVNMEHESWDVIKHQCILHALFIIGTVCLAGTEWITSQNKHEHSNKEEAHEH